MANALEMLDAVLAPIRAALLTVDAWAAPSVVRVAPLEALAETAARATGMETVMIKFTLALFLAFPHAAVNGLLPSPALRHAWAISGGIFLCQFVFGSRWVHPLAISTLCYAIIVGTRGIRALDQWRHLVSAGVSFAYLTLRHLTRSGVTATNVDDSVLQMVLTVKLYSLAYNIFDGSIDAARLDAVIASPTESAGAKKLAADRRARSLPAPPSPLEFYGYVFNPCTFFVGPAFEISEYLAGQRAAAAPPGAPSRVLAAAGNLVLGVVFLAAVVVLGPRFNMDDVYAQATAAVPPPVWRRVLYAHCVMAVVRVQYYAVWKLGEGAAQLAGFGFRAAERDWAGAANVHPLEVETLPSLAEVLRHWNIHTQSWLERYIFKRAPRAYNRWMTFAASAFWHGFYPGYYLAFFTVPLLQEASRATYALLRPALTGGTGKSPTSGPAYVALYAFKWAVRSLSLDYTLCAFLLLDARRAIAVWRSAYFVGHAAALAVVVACTLLQPLVGGPRKHHGHHGGHGGAKDVAAADAAAPASAGGRPTRAAAAAAKKAL